MSEFIVHSVPGSPFGRAVLAAVQIRRARSTSQTTPPATSSSGGGGSRVLRRMRLA
jgi:hypothetical protein